jgi:cytochrome c biogenesis protein CcdA
MILGISLIFIFLGHLTNQSQDIFKYVGFTFLFILGVMLIPGTPGDLEYRSGSEIDFSYTDNLTTNTIEQYTYEKYESFTLGFLISTAAIFGFIVAFISTKSNGGFSNE